MNPYLIAALADQRIRETRNQAARRQPSSPRPVSQPGNHSFSHVQLRRRIGITLVETGLRMLATTPARSGQ